MISLLVRLCLALFVINALLMPADAWSSGSRLRDNYDGEVFSNGFNKPNTLRGTSSGLPSQNSTRRGLGISAWGIVILVVALILAGMGLYYLSICYSICQTNKSRYDKMGMPTAA